MNLKKDPTELCSCKCHYGGAVSCPGCKKNHGVVTCGCKDWNYFLEDNIFRLANSDFNDSIWTKVFKFKISWFNLSISPSFSSTDDFNSFNCPDNSFWICFIS